MFRIGVLPQWGVLLLASTSIFHVGCAGLRERYAQRQQNNQMNAQIAAKPIKSPFSDAPKDRTAKVCSDFGYVVLFSGNYPAAEELFREAISKDKKFIPAYLGLSKAQSLGNHPDQAIETLNSAIAIDQKNGAIYNELGLVYIKAGNSQNAIASMEKAISLSPQDKAFKLNLAGLYVSTKQYDKAFNAYTQVVSPEEAHYRIAGALFSEGRHDESLAQLNAALQVNPKYEDAAAMLQYLTGEIAQVSYEGEEIDGREVSRDPNAAHIQRATALGEFYKNPNTSKEKPSLRNEIHRHFYQPGEDTSHVNPLVRDTDIQ